MKIANRQFQIAGISAAVVLVLYAIVVAGIDVSLFRSGLSDADSRVLSRLSLFLGREPRAIRIPNGPTAGEGPIFWWLYGVDGRVEVAMQGAPPMPDGLRPSRPASVDRSGHHYRVNGVQAVSVVSGQELPAGVRIGDRTRIFRLQIRTAAEGTVSNYRKFAVAWRKSAP